MTLVGCDLHSRTQQVAVLDTRTGELVEQELAHDGDAVERFYRARPPPVTIGIETTGYTLWFHALMHQLGYTVLVGEAAKVTGSHRPLARQASSQQVVSRGVVQVAHLLAVHVSEYTHPRRERQARTRAASCGIEKGLVR